MIKFNSLLLSIMTSLPHTVVPIIFIIYLSEWVSLEILGGFLVLMSLAGLTQIVVDYGFNQGAVRELGVLPASTRKQNVKMLFISITFIKLLIVAFGLILIVAISNYVTFFDSITLTAIIIGALASLTNVAWIYSGLHIIARYNNILTVYKLAFLFPVFFVDATPINFLILIYIPQLFMLLHAVILISKFTKAGPIITLYVLKKAKHLIIGNSKLAINSLTASGLAISWPLILNFYLSNEMIGIFGFADRIIKGYLMLITPVVNIVISNQISFATFRNYILFNIVVCTIGAIVFIATKENTLASMHSVTIIEIKTNAEYLFFAAPLYIANIFLYTYAIIRQDEKYYSYIVIFSTLIIFLLLANHIVDIYSAFLYETLIFMFWIVILSKHKGKKNDTI
jgi:hypothetical protein